MFTGQLYGKNQSLAVSFSISLFIVFLKIKITLATENYKGLHLS